MEDLSKLEKLNIEVKRSFLRSLRPNFGFHLVFTSFVFKIFVILGFEVAEAKFWISSSFYKFSFRISVVLGFEVI